MSSPIEVVAIITPKPGKINEIIEGLNQYSAWVEANEPGVLKYQLHKQVNTVDGQETLVFIERFKDKEALAGHRESEAYKALQERAKEEQSLAVPMDVKILEIVGGFGTRA